MKKTAAIVILVSMILVQRVFAQETAAMEVAREVPAEEAAPAEVYTFPVIEPEASLFVGYRFVDLKGDARADEFEYLHDSVALGGELRFFSFPHRFHLDLEIKNRKDYFGDLSYAYKDIFLFRGINRTLFHNLENITLTGVAAPSPGITIMDSGAVYGVKVGISTAFMRFKTPDFPFHVYIDGSLIERDGVQQLRSLSGSGYFNDIVRSSQSRDLDWHTKNFTAGANSHVGPVEIDISHSEKRFDVGGNNVFFDPYSAAVHGTTIIREAGTFPHNQISELKGSSNTLKLHTSYTGGLVASATFSKIDRENRDSGTKADYFIGAGDVTWMPVTKLTFFLKYRHKETDIDNPGSVTITDISNPANTSTFLVRPSISSVTDTISGIVRYRPLPGLTLRAEYSYDDIRRSNAEEWELPGSTQRNTASLSANVRIMKGLHFKGKYTHKELDDPAYNNEPDRSDEGRFSLSWAPIPKINVLLSYIIAGEKRDELRFVEPDGAVTTAHDRDVNRDVLMGSVTFLIVKDLSATASYSYIHNRTQQDIEFHDLAGGVHIDPSVPYRETAHNYAFDVRYVPKDSVTLGAGVSHTRSSGAFSPADPGLLQPVSVSSFSELKLRETVYSVSGEYRFKNGFGAGIQYKYSDFDDVLDSPGDDVNDGRAHIIYLALSKRW